MTDEIPAALQAALASRFELRRVLGRGGMATVYLAHDRRHERDVALKVLRPDLAASLGTERFLHEIQIAARLTHPHILALHDSGEVEGFLFYLMPYIEGRSLRHRLDQRPRFDPGEALAVARPVAEALGYAHGMGVVHRDIKPENILFSQGHPIVADFGIAKAVSTAGGANLTRTGFPLGTPGYMSPEQAAGLTDLDARTDVYSLAVVVYEMLVGEIPGRWPTEEEVRLGRILQVAPAHRLRLAEMGPRIEGALVRALAIRLDQRTPTPGALIQDLTGTAPPRRQYSEPEVQEIVRRASELEVSNPTQGGAMTIGGIEALAGEVGIARERVRAAADSLARPATPGPPTEPVARNPFLGGPRRIYIERVIPGELPESEYSMLVDEIRMVMQNVGQVSQLGRSFSWTSTRGGGATRDLEVGVTVRAGRTRIVVRENLNNLLGAVFGGIGGGMGGGGMGPLIGIVIEGLGKPPAALALLVPAWLAITYATARTAFARVSRRRERELVALADRLAAQAAVLVAPPPGADLLEPRRLTP